MRKSCFIKDSIPLPNGAIVFHSGSQVIGSMPLKGDISIFEGCVIDEGASLPAQHITINFLNPEQLIEIGNFFMACAEKLNEEPYDE